ncbi:unnamed protein product, partial [Rotaria magnacalcarata]
DLPPIRPRMKNDDTSEGDVKKTRKKNPSTLSDDDNSNSTTNEDTSIVHSSDTAPSELVKNHQAISPTITDSKKSTNKIRPLKPRYYWIEIFIETTDDGYIPIDIYTSKINSLAE